MNLRLILFFICKNLIFLLKLNTMNEQEILKFWQDNKIFEKSLGGGRSKTQNLKPKTFVFYDGPPFATGTPHYGHIVTGTIKDAIPRYWTMRGYRVERKWGWDCHGLPIENIAEKELGIKRKKKLRKWVSESSMNFAEQKF